MTSTQSSRHESLDRGYAVRPPSPKDAEEVHALITASDIEEFGEPQGYSLDELQDEWRQIDPERDAWIVKGPDDAIAGYGLIRDRRHVRMIAEGYVHPGHFRHGIGITLIRLAEDRAREHIKLAPPGIRVVIINGINANNSDARELLKRDGYAPDRYYLRMEDDLDEPPPDPEWPDGLTVRTMSPDEDGREFYLTAEEGMTDHWGHVPGDFETWQQRNMGATLDRDLWFLAMDGGEPAGAALCLDADGIGWVGLLAVRRPWRRRGLGLALLRHAAGEFHRRGLKRYALAVDSESLTGATRLYERAGMRAVHTYAGYLKELRPGAELTDLDEKE